MLLTSVQNKTLKCSDELKKEIINENICEIFVLIITYINDNSKIKLQ